MKQQNYDIDCVFDSVDGRGAIYISNYPSACNKTIRENCNIKAVISIAASGYLDYHEQLSQYMYIPASDNDQYQINKHFCHTYQFMQRNRKIGNILVHCMIGKSRSATIVAAYLVRKYKYSLNNVLSMLKRKRKKIQPNPGFMAQLEKYCEEIGVQIGAKGQDGKIGSHSRSKSIAKSILSETSAVSRSSADKNKKKDINPQINTGKTTDIAQKIERLRQKYLDNNNKIKNKNNGQKLKICFDLKNSTESETLSNPIGTQIQWRQNKSVDLG